MLNMSPQAFFSALASSEAAFTVQWSLVKTVEQPLLSVLLDSSTTTAKSVATLLINSYSASQPYLYNCDSKLQQWLHPHDAMKQ